MGTYIKSTDVSVFPATRRKDVFDRAARLPTEQNLISIVNRLVGIDSFVIEGLTVDSTGNYITTGICNIHGYIFELNKNLQITDKTSNYLYFRIAVKTDGTFEELYSIDGNLSMDSADDDDSEFRGLQLIGGDEIIEEPVVSDKDSLKYYYLLIATKSSSNVWETAQYNTLPFKWNQIQVSANSVKQDLPTYLTDSYIIDDGEL